MAKEKLKIGENGQVKKIMNPNKKSEKKNIYCISLTPSAKMSLGHYAMKNGFTGISSLLEFWAQQLAQEEIKNVKTFINEKRT